MRIIGRGTFSKVRIVQHRSSGRLYALKYINKSECIRMKAIRNVIRERDILERLDHPFLCRLRFSFQDNESMYMVTDLMLGGDLHYHINRQAFSEDVIRIWVAELVTAIKFLHANKVVHRDIKPQNILLDEKGHVYLADFNIASHMQSNRILTSTCGTTCYMAPEIFQGIGYDESVDWWSLGITLYECVFGKRPFDHPNKDELKAAIRRGNVQYVSDRRPVSGECLAMIQGFLEMNPRKRLGGGRQRWKTLLRHPFFRGVDWHKIDTRTIKPLFKPSATENNFDPTQELDDLLPGAAGNRLSPRKGGQGRSRQVDQEEHKKELQFIEERFKQFDFTVFAKYEGFKDPIKRTVGEPPDWVKPAFTGNSRHATKNSHYAIKQARTEFLASSSTETRISWIST